MEKDPSILIGNFAGAFGVQGGVWIKTYTAQPESIEFYGYLLNKEGVSYTIKKILSVKDTHVAVKVEGIETRAQAENLKGKELYIKRSSLPALSDEEYYYTDLIGLEVRALTQDRIGWVAQIYNYGAGECLEITLDSSRPDDDQRSLNSSAMISFTRQAVPMVNIKEGYVLIDEALLVYPK